MSELIGAPSSSKRLQRARAQRAYAWNWCPVAMRHRFAVHGVQWRECALGSGRDCWEACGGDRDSKRMLRSERAQPHTIYLYIYVSCRFSYRCACVRVDVDLDVNLKYGKLSIADSCSAYPKTYLGEGTVQKFQTLDTSVFVGCRQVRCELHLFHL